MVELKGSLDSVGLPAIVQLLGELRHSGRLDLTNERSRASLGFEGGRLVAVSLGNEHGMNALFACLQAFPEGEFLFSEHAPSGEHTLDLGPDGLGELLQRLASPEPVAQPVRPEPPPPAPPAQLPNLEDEDPLALGACPHLGFADDPARHYSRATALHRCFATHPASTVTGVEQHDLCLSGRYPTCARFRNIPAPVPAVVTPPPPPAAREHAPEPPRRVVPPGVAARLAIADQMGLSQNPSEAELPERRPTAADRRRVEDQPTAADRRRVADQPTAADRRWFEAAPADDPVARSRRALLLVAGGGLLGLILLIVAIVLFMPLLNGGLAPKPPGAAVQAFEPVPTPVRPAPTTAPQALAPTVAPGATLAARSASPTAAQQRTSAPPRATAVGGSKPLIDVRFASADAIGWLDNPPFAAFSDGAYRLQARQATHFVVVDAPIEQMLIDVVVSATFRKTGGPPGGGYGLVIRDQSPDPNDGLNQNLNAYVLETGDLGEFGIWRRDGDHWVDLVPWTRSSTVRPGGSPNDLTVRAIGDRLTFTVNGTDLASVQDNTLQAGAVGVFVGGDYNEVALDHFAVQATD